MKRPDNLTNFCLTLSIHQRTTTKFTMITGHSIYDEDIDDEETNIASFHPSMESDSPSFEDDVLDDWHFGGPNETPQQKSKHRCPHVSAVPPKSSPHPPHRSTLRRPHIRSG
jgi:hypothetical protein